MKAGWEVKPLGEVCDVLDRMRKPITKKDRVAGPYPYYGATGVLDSVNDFLFDEDLILIGEDGAKWGAGDNSAFAISGKTWVNNHAHVVRPFRDILLDAWLIYYLNSEDLMEYISGVTVPKLNQAKLRSIPIPLPPLEEQKRIVAVLDAAFEGLDRARTHIQTNLENARELFDATLSNFFDPTQKSSLQRAQFDNVCVLQRGFDLPKRQRTQGQYDLVTSSGVSDTHNEYKVVGPGVATGRSGSIGNVYYVERNFWPLNTALYIKDFCGNSPKYIWYFLRSFDLGRFASGAGVPTLNRNHVHEETVHIDEDATEQRAVVAKLDQLEVNISELEAIYTTKLADLADLRQSLLQKAFAGELT